MPLIGTILSYSDDDHLECCCNPVAVFRSTFPRREVITEILYRLPSTFNLDIKSIKPIRGLLYWWICCLTFMRGRFWSRVLVYFLPGRYFP